MKKIFIDGAEGTTGLKIFERFKDRHDIEILKIDPELRKDENERKKLINESDITFLCLPDAAAIEAVKLVENPNTVIIDTSTAHRTAEGWAYGFAELDESFRKNIESSKRIANPGCHASGFISIAYPLVKSGIIKKDSRLCCFSLTGYSGGGKKMIAEYEGEDRLPELDSPRQYGLSQTHKHMKEMQKICGLEKAPMFSPIVDDYYSGMEVTVYIYPELLQNPGDFKNISEGLYEFYKKYYNNCSLIKVREPGYEQETRGFYGANTLSGYDYMEIMVNGNEERAIVTARFDNLGKGASGAAIQNMNIVMGIEEVTGLVI
ncbi:MAG: N-acetyl-gamma-glutamyl-phosphate reductase [Lachnospiraceae bacterium]|nr:N-acetyl-gamma-glutamyl-phosphate reductase [Lachnospiraceae bacterium]